MKKVGDIVASAPKIRALVAPDRQQKKIIESADTIQQTAPSAAELAFIARQLVQATLPHSNPLGTPGRVCGSWCERRP
jgi:hypothetical protein